MTKINWNNIFLQRDGEGNLTKLAQAVDSIIGTGCDCGTDEPESCIVCLCEAALHEQFDQITALRAEVERLKAVGRGDSLEGSHIFDRWLE